MPFPKIGELIANSEDILPHTRFRGIYRGWVVNNNDPKKMGRIKVYVPAIHPQNMRSKPDFIPWASGCFSMGGAADFGDFAVPPIDATVFVMFEDGHPDYPIWMGTWWGSPGGNSEVPQKAQSDYPDARVIKLREGQSLTIAAESGLEFKVDVQEGIIYLRQGESEGKEAARKGDETLSNSTADTAFWTWWQLFMNFLAAGPPIPEPGFGVPSQFQLILRSWVVGFPTQLKAKINEGSAVVKIGD